MIYYGLLLQLALSAAVASWSVSYSPTSICVFERSSVDFSCSFNYPNYYTLKITKWFRPEKHQKQDGSQQGISVYHSESEKIVQLYKNRTVYANQGKNCSLQLHNVSRSDIGKYFFRFETYSTGYTGPGGIYLNVAVLPFRVTVNKAKNHIQEGDSVTLTCGTENCTPTRGPFTWFKNQRLLPQTTEHELRIASVSHKDFGNYSCGLKNSTTPGDEILLDIRYSPKNVEITVLSSGEVREGNQVTLICKSDANPAVTNYTWLKIRDANASFVGFSREFSIRSASEQDDGLYFCMATNAIGSQKSTAIKLEVKERSHRHFFLSATAVFLFAVAVMLIVFVLMMRRKQFTSKKQPAEQTPTVTVAEEIYENLRKSSEETHTTVLYADLRLPPATSDKPLCNSQEEDQVIYSRVKKSGYYE